MHGSFVDTAYRCAQAWIGRYDWGRVGGPSYYDHRVWEEAHEPVVGQDDAVFVHRRPGLEVYEVRYTEPLASSLFHQVSIDLKEWYPSIDKKTAGRAVRMFVFLFGDRDEIDLRSSLGEPPVDGYLVGLFALSDSDRLLPMTLQWRGRQLDRLELTERTGLALSFVQSLLVEPKVPAPSLPPELLDSIVEARKGNIGTSERRRFVESLLALDRTSFLEALDRMFPWINEGEAGWLDKDDQIADRLWEILGEIPRMKGRMRLAPWKTGLGQPKSLRIRVVQDSSGPLSYHDRVVEAVRTEFGPYRVVGGR